MLAAVSIAMNCPSVYMHLLPFHVVDSYQLCESICIHMDGWIDRQADRHAGRQADILLNYVFAYMVYVHLCRFFTHFFQPFAGVPVSCAQGSGSRSNQTDSGGKEAGWVLKVLKPLDLGIPFLSTSPAVGWLCQVS